MNNNYFKNYLLDDEKDDEIETVFWEECDDHTKKYYNCGCCDECLCDDNKQCSNCGCNCNCDDIDDEDSDEESDEEPDKEPVEDPDNFNLSKYDNLINSLPDSILNFDINIIKCKEKGKKVRITLKLNVSLNNKKEIINIDLDINENTYLKIADELFKK